MKATEIVIVVAFFVIVAAVFSYVVLGAAFMTKAPAYDNPDAALQKQVNAQKAVEKVQAQTPSFYINSIKNDRGLVTVIGENNGKYAASYDIWIKVTDNDGVTVGQKCITTPIGEKGEQIKGTTYIGSANTYTIIGVQTEVMGKMRNVYYNVNGVTRT